MACLWQKESSGVWCITYRQNGKQKVRSLKTTNNREAIRLQREIEAILQNNIQNGFTVMENPVIKEKNPTFNEFWPKFFEWAEKHRTYSTGDEYRNWFMQFKEFVKYGHLGDVSESDIEAFKLKLLRRGKNKPKNKGNQRKGIASGTGY